MPGRRVIVVSGEAEEQAALRRVATLVARGTAPQEVFAAVTEEVGRVLPVDFAIMARYEGGVALTVLAASGTPVAAGSRWSLGGNNVSTRVFETGLPARINSYSDRSSGAAGVAARERGIRSTVATPVTVEGRRWGAMIVGSFLESSLPSDIEARLTEFTELLATAIANAESRAGLARLAEEQAALRRVATLVAQGASPEDVFTAVVDEVMELFPFDYAGLARYDANDTVTAVAARGTTHFPVGSSLVLGGKNTATLVFETGRPVRIDGYAEASGPMGDTARERGVRSSVAAPIIVEGRLWGTIGAGSTGERPLPPDTEARLADFTDMAATAIANAESRAGLARLAQEQAALRRVATLVARGTAPEEVFAAVVDEVGQLLPVQVSGMARYESDESVTFVAAWGDLRNPFKVGSRLMLGGNNLGTIVFKTGRSARIDSYADRSSGPLGAGVRDAGIRSSVATPIIVEGRLWGLIFAGSFLQEPLPQDSEARLAGFTELVATAIANAESRAALAASRARIVAAADESRRRIERDLHDGGQQRLVHAVIVLKLALRALSNGDANAEELVSEALRHAEQANAELRELAHGIVPAALTRGGLRAGVEALVSRVSLPVSVDVSVDRLAAGLEATAYFVVSEALTNAVKHARAARAEVTARVEDGELRIEVCDDGVGGARADHTSGLGGLEDRVSALGGRLVLDSPPGAGTRLCALLPVSGPGEALSPRVELPRYQGHSRQGDAGGDEEGQPVAGNE
jgi:GAF domain-containing protein